MAAARISAFDDANLRIYALAHRIGMAYHANLLALRRLKHGERVDDGGECVLVERSEALVYKQVVERDIAR